MSDPIPGTGMNVPNAPPTAEPSVLNITLSQESPFSIENTAVKSEPKIGILPKVFLNALLRSFTLFFPRNFKAPRPNPLFNPLLKILPLGAVVGERPDVLGGGLNADGFLFANLCTLLSACSLLNPFLSASRYTLSPFLPNFLKIGLLPVFTFLLKSLTLLLTLLLLLDVFLLLVLDFCLDYKNPDSTYEG